MAFTTTPMLIGTPPTPATAKHFCTQLRRAFDDND
jgi:hypothetical protein